MPIEVMRCDVDRIRWLMPGLPSHSLYSAIPVRPSSGVNYKNDNTRLSQSLHAALRADCTSTHTVNSKDFCSAMLPRLAYIPALGWYAVLVKGPNPRGFDLELGQRSTWSEVQGAKVGPAKGQVAHHL